MRNFAIFSLLALLPGALATTGCAVSDNVKVDCGYVGINQQGCESKGCCWSPAGQGSSTPWCFYGAQQTTSGYSLTNFVETSTGFSGDLSLNGAGTSNYGADLKNLHLDVVYETSEVIHVKITDQANQRWEIPESVVERFHASSKPASTNYKFYYNENPFTFEIIRVSDGQSLFKLSDDLVYKDQYLEFTALFDSSSKTFGLGESTRLNHALLPKTYTMWAGDIAALGFDRNLYGSFPFYLQLINGQAHGTLLLNSNGMDAVLQSNSLTFKTLGGVIDLYVFSGSSPADVISQYTSIIGRPTMFPYWSLGFHNCKYGYKSVWEVEAVVANYTAAGIPMDTQWMDIDYMQEYRDFTTDAVNFPQPEVAKLVAQLHDNGQHFVPIIDPGIMVFKGYDAYEQGLKQDLFIKDITGGYYLGQVWPGPTYFPDFFNPNTQSYWTNQLQSFHDNVVDIDGLWIDMNEIANFCNVDGRGQVCANTAPEGCPAPGKSQTDCCLVCTEVDPTNSLDYPPYQIGNYYGKLGTKTVAASAQHYNNITVYNAHNLYGLSEQIATNKALVDIRGKRPFVLSRSSFPSTGVHSAKWTGDNGATWNDLKSSIISIMDFNLFGIPMIGADICGFIYDTTEELCARWIEVGAFYPFSRNHNALGNAPQELYLWDSVAEASRNALGMRYQLLPYLYTLFYRANQLGETVARPLWMNFASDATTAGIEMQFMLGSAILVSPVTDQGATSVKAYFPQQTWYDFAERSLAVDASAGGVWKTLDTPLTSVNVHVSGGNILPLQQKAMTTTEGRKTPFTLLTAICPNGKAWGNLFWDDGEQVQIKRFLSVSYEASSIGSTGSFISTVDHDSFPDSVNYTVGEIVVMAKDLNQAPAAAALNGVDLSSAQIVFDSAKKSLTFTNLNLKLNTPINLQWS